MAMMLKETLQTWLFGFIKIPLVFFCKPQVITINQKRCELKIPLSRKTKNHVRSMYFGALAVGADLAGGLFLMKAISDSKKPVTFLFKDFTADFKKRAMSDVHFHCDEGKEVYALVDKCIKSGKRENKTINMYATTPKVTGDEVIASFTLTFSVKMKS